MFCRLHGVAKTKFDHKKEISKNLYKTVFILQMSETSVWAPKMTNGHHRGRANSAEGAPLQVIRGVYKTTSTMSLPVLAGVPLVDLDLRRIIWIEKVKFVVRRGGMTMAIAEIRKVRYGNNNLNLW
ncbi:unnamed protein product [Macrosiphum euphorbiae]|uniref:Uncharacterized protein n=1 Tax=Macrosiphum euphorbiae TaxID=13131 RepID=A0AAV0XWQ0_9HEMI|nr:unnamed protein product [Macrosiphum euphorbiae]